MACDLGTKSFNGKRLFSIPVEKSKITDEVIVYVGKINESEIKLQPGFSEEIKWMPLEQAILEPLAFEHVEIIEKYLDIRNT